jgi:hypothetical protein
MNNFVIVVDNEVVGNITFSDQLQEGVDVSKYLAVYRSNPKFIEHNEKRVEEGYIWDGQNFNPPVE